MAEKIRILVTGATGLVGEAIISRFLEEDNLEIIAVGGRKTFPDLENTKQIERFYRADIARFETLKIIEKEKKIDFVFHCAGLAHQFGKTSREDFFKINVNGTENIGRLAAALEASRFVFISSVSVYGNYGSVLVDETFQCQPEGFYAESKLEAENAARDICSRNKIELVILRLGTVIGEGDKGNVMRLIRTIESRRFFWIGKGKNKKTLIYKKDVAEACLKLLARDYKGGEKGEEKGGEKIFNLAAKPVEMKKVVDTIARNLQKKIPRISFPAGFFKILGRLNRATLSNEKINLMWRTLEKWLGDDMYSGERFYRRYNFEPATEIEFAIKKQVEHYLNSKFK